MPPPHKPWDDNDDDQTPYGVSGEPPPSRREEMREMDVVEDAPPPRRKKGIPDDDPPEDVSVRKKKRRKKRDIAYHAPDIDDVRDRENEKREWVITGVLFAVGFALMLAGAIGVSGKKDFEGVRTAYLVLGSMISVAIAIPITIVALVVGGSVLGIEYGTPVSAIRNLAAVFMFLDGIDWIFAWLGMPLAGRIVSLVIGYGLLMNRFDLDVWELWATVVAMKVVGFVIHIGLVVLLFQASSDKKRTDFGHEHRPAVAQAAFGNPAISSCT